MIVGITSVAATVGHTRSGNVGWRTGLVFGLAGAATSHVSSVLNRSVDPDVLLLAFAALMLVAAAAMVSGTVGGVAEGPGQAGQPVGAIGQGVAGAVSILERAAAPPRTTRVSAKRRRIANLVSAAAVVGFLTGFLGVGGGFIVVPAPVVALDLPMTVAVGTSLLVIAFNSRVALIARSGAAIA